MPPKSHIKRLEPIEKIKIKLSAEERLKKYEEEGKYQVRRYQKYCNQNGLDPTFPMKPEQLAAFLDSIILATPSNLKSCIVSQMSRAVSEEGWSKMMRRNPVVKKALIGSKITTISNTYALATVCKRRRLDIQKWIVTPIFPNN